MMMTVAATLEGTVVVALAVPVAVVVTVAMDLT
jgi:hypothetical protein